MDSSTLPPRPFTPLGQLSVPANVAFVRAVLGYVGEIGRLFSLDDVENNALQLAVDEAFCNAVTHYGSSGPEEETVQVDVTLLDAALVVSIRERGIPFDPTKATAFSTDSLDAALKPGIGMHLMKGCVDKVEFLMHGRAGKEVRLTKRLRDGTLPALLAAVAPVRKRITVRDPEVRIPSAEEITEISKLAWRCYGYSQEALLYNPTELAHHFEAGLYVPIVAADPATGELFGHECLKFHGPGATVPELGLAFIDPHYRCAGLSARMARDLVAWARERGCQGIFDCSVTTHTMSQKHLQEQLGSVPCSMFMGIAARGMRVKELASSEQSKGTVVNHYHVIDRTPATLFPPENHREIVGEIYGWLGLPREFAQSSGEQARGESAVDVFHMPEELNADMITIRTIGADCGDRVRKIVNESRRARKDAVYAFLPLQSPHLPALFAECEALGLSFAGVMPHIHFGEDRILMQWVGIPLDMEAIHVHGDRSRKLFAYVRTCLGRE